MNHTAFVVTLAALSGGCALFWESPGTALGMAAHRGDVVTIRTLLAEGADPNGFDASGQTALHWAARGGHRIGPHECRGEAPERVEVITALIDGGADVNLTDRRGAIPGGSSGWTPLHVALHHEQFAAASRMLARGADPNIRSAQGKSVMEVAAEEGAPADLLKTLLASGFDPQKASGAADAARER